MFLYRLTCWTPSMTTLNSKSIFILICISLLVTEIHTQAVTFIPISTSCNTESLSTSCHTPNRNEKSPQKPYVFILVHFFRAMSSPTNKEQFLKQFDSIVRGIVDNKERVGKPSTCSRALTTGFMFSRACHPLCFPAFITLGFTFLLRVLIG